MNNKKSIRAIYRRSRSIPSFLIRAFTWGSYWSHVGILGADGHVIEASGWHGVVKTPLGEFLAKASEYECVDIYCPDPERALTFSEAQVGKPYDWGAVFGIVFRRNWAEDDSWFCFELLEAALVAGSRVRFREGINRITGNLSYLPV